MKRAAPDITEIVEPARDDPKTGDVPEMPVAQQAYRNSVPGLMIADIMNQKEFGMRLVTGVAGWQSRLVVGAEMAGAEPTTSSLDIDLLVVTDGIGLRRHADAQRAFVDRLHETSVAALLFITGLTNKAVPRALVEHAQQRGLTVLEMPSTTLVRDVVGFVYRTIGNDEARLFKRLTGMQRYLMDALGNDHPEEVLLRRLARVCSATTAIVADDTVIASTATIPARAIVEYLQDQPPTQIEWEVAGWRTTAVPVERPDNTRCWLLALRRGTANDEVLVRAALEATSPLLTALGTLGNAALVQQRAVRSAVLKSAIEASSGMEMRMVAHRADALGLNFSEPVRAWVLTHLPGTKGAHSIKTLEALHDRAQRQLELAGVTFLSLRRTTDVVVASQGEEKPTLAVLEELLDGDPQLVVAGSDPFDDLGELPRVLREAGFLARMPRLGEEKRLRRSSDLTLSGLVLASLSPNIVEERARSLLHPILDSAILAESLDAYFVNHLDVPKASNALHIHANTMRYRLDRIGTIVGGSLRDPHVLADLVLARTFVAEAAAEQSEPLASAASHTALIKNAGAGRNSESVSATESMNLDVRRQHRGAAGPRVPFPREV